VEDVRDSLTPVDLPPDFVDEDEVQDPFAELKTTDLQLYKVDLRGKRLEMIGGLPDCALFLGLNGSMSTM
jgi:hypothetical protein